jgi:hypothetical protein
MKAPCFVNARYFLHCLALHMNALETDCCCYPASFIGGKVKSAWWLVIGVTKGELL